MDMSKAFDMVEWGELFNTLIKRKVDAIFLRLILFIYTNQQCYVKWCGTYSKNFNVQNGVRQGGVTSGIFFAVYIDELLKILRKSGLGCHIHGVFYGALIFADDIILLSASRNRLQIMVNICQEFVSSRNLKFGTDVNPEKSKTKYILFTKRKQNSNDLAPLVLDGCDLPWVKSIKHLGHTLQADNSMKLDIAQKRGAYIGKVNALLQEFGTVSPHILLRLIHTYAGSVYGSNLWDLFSNECERLYTSYNVTVRNVLRIDRCSHRYLLESLSDSLHLKTMILSRYVSFHKSLIECDKFPVRFLARLQEKDTRTVLGRTMAKLSELCNVDIDKLSSRLVKDKVKYRIPPENEQWRIGIAAELIKIRDEEMVLDEFSVDERNAILKHICTT